MNIEICKSCPIYNDGLLQLGVRKTHKVSPRLIENHEQKRILIIAECPGENEDLQNKALVGRSGKLVDELLKLSGLDKYNIRISNTVKCRAIQRQDSKYKNRNPDEKEVKACLPYLQEDWQFDPDLIILLGKIATKAVFPDKDPSLIRGKGQIINIHGRDIIAIPTYHPAWALYAPNNKPTLMRHFNNIAEFMTTL